MRLSARILENVASVNAWDYAQVGEFTEGDAPTIYFQLVDLSKDRAERGFVPAGRRYVPSAGATLSVTLDNIDDARKITKTATQPYAQDPSIWALVLTTADKLRGTVNMKLTLTESGAKVSYGTLQPALNVSATDGMTRL
jgi:hypothetical protein